MNSNLPPGCSESDTRAPWNQMYMECPYCDGNMHRCDCLPYECDCNRCEHCNGTGMVDWKIYWEWEEEQAYNSAEDRADERRKYGD